MKTKRNVIKNIQGFTLIELVIVIIVLGILAAIAIPKFINLQHDARAAVINGIEGSLADAAKLGHAYAVVHDLEMQRWQGEPSADDKQREYHFNYPATTDKGMPMFINIDTPPNAISNDTSKGNEFIWMQGGVYFPNNTVPVSMYYTYRELVKAEFNPPYATANEIKSTHCYAKYSIFASKDMKSSWITTESVTTGC